MDRLKTLGGFILSIIIILGIIFVFSFFITKGFSIAEKINPILVTATTIGTLVCLFVFTPLAFFKYTRIVSTFGFFIASYIFGLSLWVYGFLVTVYYLGVFWLIIGLLLGGVGVVPLGMIGSGIHGEWGVFGNLIYGLVITYGARSIAFYLEKKDQPMENQPYYDV